MGVRSPSAARRARPPPPMGAAGGAVVSPPPRGRGPRLVEEPDEQPRHARLGLAALAEEDDVLAGEERVLDLGDAGLLVADDPGKERLAAAEPRDQVVAQLLLDGPGDVAARRELADRARPRRHATAPPARRRARSCRILSCPGLPSPAPPAGVAPQGAARGGSAAAAGTTAAPRVVLARGPACPSRAKPSREIVRG